MFASVVAVAMVAGVGSFDVDVEEVVSSVSMEVPEAFASHCGPGEVHDPVTGECVTPKDSGEGESGSTSNVGNNVTFTMTEDDS